MKKFLTVPITAALIFGLTACANDSAEHDRSDPNYSHSFGQEQYPAMWDILPEIEVTPESELEYKYTPSLGGITVTKYTGEALRVRIPDKIEGEPVVKIDFSGIASVADESMLTELIVPDTVREIEVNPVKRVSIKYTNYPAAAESVSFFIWSNLEAVYIPYGVTELCDGAFDMCPRLKSVMIPNSVVSIGDKAFEFCTALTEITIPGSVTKIGAYAFASCTGFTGITIPDSVSEIGEYAFSNCSGITEIVIPNGVSVLEDGLFSKCSGLKNVIIPDSVTSIGMGAFYKCASLETITIPDSVVFIGEEAFDGCASLTSIVYKGKTYSNVQINDLYNAVNG